MTNVQIKDDLKKQKKPSGDKFKEEKEIENYRKFDGLSLSFAFLLSGLLSFLLPNFLGNEVATNCLVFVLIMIGLLGLGIEMNKLNKSKKKFIDSDFVIGFVLIMVWIFTYHFFEDPMLNFLYLSVFFFGVFGISRSILRLINEILKTEDRKTAIYKGVLGTIKFAITLFTLYESLQKVGIL